MELSFELILAFLALGLFVGFIAGLLGIGGGGTMVPILTAIFYHSGVEMDKAVPMALGTSMASIIVTSYSSMRAHKSRGNVLWSAFRSMTPGVVAGVILGAFLVSITKTLYLAIFFSIFMAYVSIQLFIDKKPKPTRKLLPKPYLAGAGGFIGTISALVSIGGGSLTVPFLIWQNVDGKKAIGTSAAIGFPLSITGALCYMVISGAKHVDLGSLTLGYVYAPAVIFISMMTFFTAKLGADMTHKVPTSVLKKLLGILNMILCIKMLYSVAVDF